MNDAPIQPADCADAAVGVRSAQALCAQASRCETSQLADVSRVSRPGFRFGVVASSHFVADLYPMFIISLVAVLQTRLALSETQAALLISFNGVVSGLSQPIFAWIGDRLDTRLFGALGLAVGAAALSSIGFAQTFGQLLALQFIGMAGIGVFHPISSALAGRLGRDTFHRAGSKRSARSVGLAIFFAAGVGGGGFLGPLIASRTNAQTVFDIDGLRLLSLMAVPGLATALFLWMTTARVPHRVVASSEPHESAIDTVATKAQRWITIALLFASNTLRFIVNMGLLYLYKRWAEVRIAEAPSGAADVIANLHSNVIAATALGMGVSTLIIGRLVSHGGERRAMILTALLSAPIVMLMPDLGEGGMLVAAGLAAFGFFSVIPTSLSLAQRLLPHSTGLTGSILMGCGWAISAVGPLLGAWMTARFSLGTAFIVFGVILALSGVVASTLSRRLIRAAAELG